MRISLNGDVMPRSDGLIFPGVLYCFISSYDVVFVEHHHFNLGQNGLAFLVRSFLVSLAGMPTERI